MSDWEVLTEAGKQRIAKHLCEGATVIPPELVSEAAALARLRELSEGALKAAYDAEEVGDELRRDLARLREREAQLSRYESEDWTLVRKTSYVALRERAEAVEARVQELTGRNQFLSTFQVTSEILEARVEELEAALREISHAVRERSVVMDWEQIADWCMDAAHRALEPREEGK